MYLMDGSIVTAPNGGSGKGPSPTHRGRLGSKRGVITEGSGKPIGIISSKANRDDARLFLKTLHEVKIEQREGTPLKMDKGYSGALLTVVPRKGARGGLKDSGRT